MLITFPALLVYLLPGFLGLWVFKNSVQEDIDRRSESTQIAIALLLGIMSVGLLFAVNFVLSGFPSIAEYVSPNALLPREVIGEREAHVILEAGAKFWISYAVLCMCALLSGGICAFLREKGFSLTSIVSDYVNVKLNRGVHRSCESAMRALIDEMREKGNEPSLLRIYSLSEGRENALIGWWDGYSESEKEIKLSLLESCEAATKLSQEFDLQTRRCVVNYSSGIVIEFLDIEESQAKGFEEYIKGMYCEVIHSRRKN